MGCDLSITERPPQPRTFNAVTHDGQAPDVSEPHSECGEKLKGNEETPASGDKVQDVPSSSVSEIHKDENEEMVIASIRVADVAVDLGRIPAGFYTAVQYNGREWRTANVAVSVHSHIIEWDGPIPIPSDPSTTLCIGVYASFEFQPMLGDGELLRKLTVTVEQLFESSANVLPFTFLPKDGGDTVPCSSILVTVKKRKHESHDLSTPRVLNPHCLTTEFPAQLEDATNRGHSALSRYRKHGERRDLECSIEQFERALDTCPLDHPCRAPSQSNLAMAKLIHCQLADSNISLDVPLTLYHNALTARPVGHPDRPQTLIQLAAVHYARFEKQRDEVDAAKAEALLREALDLSSADSQEKRAAISALQLLAGRTMEPVPSGHQSSVEQDFASGTTDEDPLTLSAQLLSHFQQFGELDDLQRAISLLVTSVQSTSDHRRILGLANLGSALLQRFNRLGEPSDLEQGILRLTDTLDLIPYGRPGKSICLNNLGKALLTRFMHRRELRDLELAIARLGEAVDLSPDDHPNKLACLSNLGNAFHARFDHLAQLSDLERAISRFRSVVDLTPDEQPSKPSRLNKLGNAFKTRFGRVGDLRDLEQAISMFRHAVDLTPDGYPGKPSYLNELGKTFRNRFQRLGEQSDLEQAISRHRAALELSPDGHPDRPDGLNAIGSSFLARFQCLGDPSDLQQAISMQTDAVDLIPDDHPNKPSFLNDIGNTFLFRFFLLRESSDIHHAISRHEEAIRLVPDGHPRKPSILAGCGNAFLQRFRLTGEPSDLERAISGYKDAIDLTPDGHLDKPTHLHNLGTAFEARFGMLGEMGDLGQAILRYKDAAHLTPDGDADKPIQYDNLGKAYKTRFEQTGDLSDLEQAIAAYGNAVFLTPKGHLSKPNYLHHLSNSFFDRFKRLGALSDLEQASSRQTEALSLIPEDHPNKPVYLHTLGDTLIARFKRLRGLPDLHQAIGMFKRAVDLTPDAHRNKPDFLGVLGDALFDRFECLGELDDLEHAILRYRDSVDLTLDSHPRKPMRLIDLCNALKARFMRLGELCDLEQSMSLGSAAVDLIPDGHPDKAGPLSCLGDAYRIRFERLGALSDIEQAISKLMDAVDLSPDDHLGKSVYLNNLGNAFNTRFLHFGKLSDLEQAMSVHSNAVEFIPDGHSNKASYINDLGNAFRHRFQLLGEPVDLEQVITKYKDAVDLSPAHLIHKPIFLNNLGNTRFTRFKRFGDLSDLEQAILSNNEAVQLTPDGHPNKRVFLDNLGDALNARFDRIGELTDLERAISIHRHAVEIIPDDHPSKAVSLISLANSLFTRFHHLGELSDLEQVISKSIAAVHLTPEGHRYRPVPLSNLGHAFLARFKRLGELRDLDQATAKFMDADNLIPGGHPDKPIYLNYLGNVFRNRFQRLGEPSDLELAILTYKNAVDLTPDEHPSKPERLNNLGAAFAIRFEHAKERDSLEQTFSLYSRAACASTGPTTTRFLASQKWILCAQLLNHHTLLDAYSVAIGFLPQLAWIGLPLRQRYRELIRGADVVREAAAAALDSDRPQTAVEWLEQGRSIVWGELFQLRSSYEELSSAYPDHARRLRQLSTALEHAGVAREKSFPSPSEQVQRFDYHPTDSLEQETNTKHRMLAIERDKLLQEIRVLPSFERFLLHKEFSQLRSSAHSGPVVILNAAESRCDALIIRADVDHVIHVPLPNFTLKRSLGLQNTVKILLGHRVVRGDERVGNPTTRPGISWHFVLSSLWRDVVKPVLDVLDFSTPTGELPRIFWCPTGPFAFLPIHAAGLYDTQSSGPGYKISDFVVSSYIPTVSILAPSPEPGVTSESGDDLRLLAVCQPASDGQSRLPGVDIELKHIKATLRSAPLARTSLLESSAGTVEEVLDLMKEADWVHFACHGVQDTENPTDSGLCLADKRRLKLSDIIALSRPRGGLAFLSACQTATGDKDLSDEAIHIAAGMLFAGYGGIVGTMWSISDRFAPLVAKDVYEHLFRNGRPDYREAARALQDAVGRLRDTHKASFVDWLPFIYVGF